MAWLFLNPDIAMAAMNYTHGGSGFSLSLLHAVGEQHLQYCGVSNCISCICDIVYHTMLQGLVIAIKCLPYVLYVFSKSLRLGCEFRPTIMVPDGPH